MARKAAIHRAVVELSHVDRGVYGEHTLTVARHPSETLERTLMRLLAFGLRYAPGLEFGRGVSTTDEPDLWRRAGDGAVLDWIEVGQPDARRIVKAARRAERCDVFAFGPGARRWRENEIDREPLPPNVGIAWIDDELVSGLASGAERQIRWSLTVAEGTIYVGSGDESFECVPEIWLGRPLD